MVQKIFEFGKRYLKEAEEIENKFCRREAIFNKTESEITILHK